MHSSGKTGVKYYLKTSGVRRKFGSTRLALTSRSALTLVALLALLFIAARAHAQTETPLHSFTGTPDGANPYYSGLVADISGNFYGTTLNGGANGVGSVFKLTPSGTETVLYSFAGSPNDGANPYAGLVLDKKGNLYGVTASGGNGYGAVFELTAAGTEKVLYSFNGTPDGETPYKALVLGKKGILYGTTIFGGTYGLGTVFEVTVKTGAEKVLYNFTGGADGAEPWAGLVFDKNGNLYGATSQGGAYGGGTVFQLTPTGTFNLLYSFAGSPDGYEPTSPLIFDKKGNLYGTTAGGGNAGGCGTVFELLAPSWTTENQLHSFNGSDGCYADSPVALDKKGNLYGTTYLNGAGGYGTVYEVTRSGTFIDLYDFTGGADGGNPLAGVIFDKAGNLYSTTSQGGASGGGTVFKLTP